MTRSPVSISEGLGVLAERSVKLDALISPCGLYRYWLTREWDARCFKLPIIMLNPSTADASIDDPTIRRCMAFAKREGFGGIRVMNLFAFRATSPDEMKVVSDPVGSDNNIHLDRLLRGESTGLTPSPAILAAWGTHGDHQSRAKDVFKLARAVGAPLVCLGITKDGHPRHPLYVKGDQPFVPFGEPPSQDISS